jgi:hypothetical protein
MGKGIIYDSQHAKASWKDMNITEAKKRDAGGFEHTGKRCI